MKPLAYIGAVLVFVIVYLLSAVVGAFVLAHVGRFIVAAQGASGVEQNAWWLKNVTPIFIFALAGWIGAFAASTIVSAMFRTVALIWVAAAFVVLMILLWVVNLVMYLSGTGGASNDLYGVVTAIVASITAISQGVQRWRAPES